MKLLVKKETYEIYMDVLNTYIDPILVLKQGNRQEKLTTDSGELELPVGKFMMNDNLIENLKKAECVLNDIADKDSIEYISDKRRVFKLKDEYLEKARAIYLSK